MAENMKSLCTGTNWNKEQNQNKTRTKFVKMFCSRTILEQNEKMSFFLEQY